MWTDFREIVGRRLAIRTPMKSSMDMPNHGFWRVLLTSGAVSLAVKASARMTGVRTIQQPPGAGTPRKKFFQ